MQMTYSVFTDKGSRAVNEDSFYAEAANGGGCFAVCDGLGGHGKGDAASMLVCKSFENAFLRQAVQSGGMADFLKNAMREAQAALLTEQERLSSRSAMKTTAVLLVLSPDAAHYAHVGDSRLYHFKNGTLAGHTPDHSVPQMLVNLGELEEREIRHHVDRNRLLRVLGVPWEKDKFDLPAELVKLSAGDSFLLCSDGFWEWLEEAQMAELLRKARSAEEWLSSMAKAVKRHGMFKKMDNYTAIGVWVR